MANTEISNENNYYEIPENVYGFPHIYKINIITLLTTVCTGENVAESKTSTWQDANEITPVSMVQIIN